MGAQGCVSMQWEQLWSLELQGPTCRAPHPWAKSSWTTCSPWASLTGRACGNPTQEWVTQHFLSAETRNRLGKDLPTLLCSAPKPEHTNHQWAQKSKHTSAKRLICLLQEEGATAARYSCRIALSGYLSAFHCIVGPASKMFYDLLKFAFEEMKNIFNLQNVFNYYWKSPAQYFISTSAPAICLYGFLSFIPYSLFFTSWTCHSKDKKWRRNNCITSVYHLTFCIVVKKAGIKLLVATIQYY